MHVQVLVQGLWILHVTREGIQAVEGACGRVVIPCAQLLHGDALVELFAGVEEAGEGGGGVEIDRPAVCVVRIGRDRGGGEASPVRMGLRQLGRSAEYVVFDAAGSAEMRERQVVRTCLNHRTVEMQQGGLRRLAVVGQQSKLGIEQQRFRADLLAAIAVVDAGHTRAITPGMSGRDSRRHASS